MNAEWKSLLIYMAKCITAVVVVFGLARVLQYKEIIWPLVSAILVLTPDSQEAVPLAAIRIGANLIASATSLLFMLLGPANIVTLELGFVDHHSVVLVMSIDGRKSIDFGRCRHYHAPRVWSAPLGCRRRTRRLGHRRMHTGIDHYVCFPSPAFRNFRPTEARTVGIEPAAGVWKWQNQAGFLTKPSLARSGPALRASARAFCIFEFCQSPSVEMP